MAVTASRSSRPRRARGGETHARLRRTSCVSTIVPMRRLVFVIACSAVGCALPSNGAGADAGAGAPDGAACAPEASAECAPVPSGWSLVAYATPKGTPCPAGFTRSPTDWVEGPEAHASECDCGACQVSPAPSCAGGPVSVFYD